MNAIDDAATHHREEAIKVVRHTMKQHAQKIGTCDRENRATLREWMDAISQAKSYAGANDGLTPEIVGVLASGGV